VLLHKTDHRMAANNTVDAIRAAEWHLYFPNQRLHDGLEPCRCQWNITYYVTAKDTNTGELSIASRDEAEPALAHVSQWSPAVSITVRLGSACG